MARVSNEAKSAKAAAEAQAAADAKAAASAPAIITARTETQEQDLVKLNERIQHSNAAPGEKSLDDAIVPEFDARPVDHEKYEMLKFFNDDLRIRVATNGDKNAEQVFEINVNGRPELFRRGETKTVKRYVVDHMLRMKVTTYTQKEVTNDAGERSKVNIPNVSLKYDFSVEHDPHPRGKEWLRATMMEP